MTDDIVYSPFFSKAKTKNNLDTNTENIIYKLGVRMFGVWNANRNSCEKNSLPTKEIKITFLKLLSLF